MPAPRTKIGKAIAVAGLSAALILVIVGHHVGYNTFRQHASEKNAETQVSQLGQAVEQFYGDHHAYPILSPYSDHIGIADAELVHALNGTNPIINPRNTVYLTPPPTSLSPDDAFIDPWGSPYHLHIDTTFNRRITNPKPDTDRPEIPATVLVYSAGPDRDPTTWSDNITSWD